VYILRLVSHVERTCLYTIESGSFAAFVKHVCALTGYHLQISASQWIGGVRKERLLVKGLVFLFLVEILPVSFYFDKPEGL